MPSPPPILTVHESTRYKVLGQSLSHCEQRKPLHRSTVNMLLHKYGEKARLPVAVRPNMLPHACGFAPAEQGADNQPLTQLGSNSCGGRGLQKSPVMEAGR